MSIGQDYGPHFAPVRTTKGLAALETLDMV